MYYSFHKHIDIDIDNIKKCFFEETSMLQWFLNDNLTLKTGEIIAENSALSSQEYITFLNILK